MPSKWFLRLPELPQSIIINQLGLTDILKLSTVSPETKAVVQSASVFLDNIQWRVADDYQSNIVTERNDSKEYVSFKEADFELPNNLMKVDFAGEKCQVYDSKDLVEPMSQWFLKINKDTLEVVSKNLLEMFRVPIFDVSLEVRDPLACFVWKYSKRYRVMVINLTMTRDAVTMEEVKFILEDVESEYLHLILKEDQTNFKYSNGLRHPRFTIENPYFLDFNSILNSTSVDLNFRHFRPLAIELNTFLKSWMEGKMDNLEVFNTMWHDQPLNSKYEKKVMADIEYTEWDPEVKEKVLSCSFSDGQYVIENGLEIVRNDQQKRGVIIFDRQEWHSSFRFYAYNPDRLVTVVKKEEGHGSDSEEELEGLFRRI